MNNDKANTADNNVDDLIMDSMLRQFVNSEVQRFRFAEKVNAAIRDSQEQEFNAVETDDQNEDWSISGSEWSGGKGRIFTRAAQVAAIAAAILLAIWLPNLPEREAKPVAQNNEAPATTNSTQPSTSQNADVIQDDQTAGESVKSVTSQEQKSAIADIETPTSKNPAEQKIAPYPSRSELVLSQDESNGVSGGSMKILRAANGVDENNDIATGADNADVPQEKIEDDADVMVATNQPKAMDASLFPTRKLAFKVELNSTNKSAYVSINDEKIPHKMLSDNLAHGLKLLEPEVSRRIRFIGPRVGNIVGTIEFKSSELRFGLDFENERQLRSAFTRICDRLENFGASSRRRNRSAVGPEKFLQTALKKTNEVLRRWAKDSLVMGNVSLEPDFESDARFQRVIGQASLERFAETGYFKIPEPEEIYLPSTQLQFLQSDNLRDDLLASTRQLDLFRTKEEMQEFANKYSRGGGTKSGRRRNTSREPLAQIIENREDLQGLPMVMNDDCHMDDDRAQKMAEVSRTVGPILNRFDRFASRNVNMHPTARRQMLNQQIGNVKSYFSRTSNSPQSLLTIDQMLQIEDVDMRIELVKLLEESRSPMSASLLASYAKFDLSPRVRVLATSALSGFPRSFFRDKLLDGMRYPWPEAAKHSAEALVRLNDIESIPKLVDMLKEPDPRRPFHQDGQYVKKELVAINHLKNCMLCHADSQNLVDHGRAPVPTWEQELPRTYYNFRSPGLLMARADITYMRQDFSVVQKVEDAKPWPSHQRFDYVVQNRRLSKDEYEQLMLEQTMDSNTYEQAIVFALRKLTGKAPADNSFESWNEIASRMRVLP